MAERKSYVSRHAELGRPGHARYRRPRPGFTASSSAGRPVLPPPGGRGIWHVQHCGTASWPGSGPADPGPPHWAVYVTVADIDATAAKVTDTAASCWPARWTFSPPAAGRGRGPGRVAPFLMWQPGDHIGAQLVNEPGAFTWNELATTDLPGARDFYISVFGWGAEGDPGNANAAIFTIGRQAGVRRPCRQPGRAPVLVDLVRRRRLRRLDGKGGGAGRLGAHASRRTSDFGRGAVVADPQGAVFGIGAVKRHHRGLWPA